MRHSRLVLSLGVSLLASLSACATEEDAPIECLPGDVDCTPGAEKSDAWDFTNDPKRLSNSLKYKLSDLPRSGKLNRGVWRNRYPSAPSTIPVAWADTYWPTASGSHNARWQGASEKSPLEKYDQAFNGAAGCATQPASVCGPGSKAAWDQYNTCAGPAAKWQSQSFQNAGIMHDGRDNNGKDGVDECSGSDGNDGIATWWGTCHAWSRAALMEPEPQKAVTVNGVTFGVGDIKALIQNLYDRTPALMLGGRCNSMETTHSVTGSANHECADVNPGSLHVILANFIGRAQLPLVEDRTGNFEVWNQPILAYDVQSQNVVTAAQAMQCVGATGDRWTYNTSARKLVEVRTEVTYLSESHASNTPHGWESNTSTDDYHYILELSSDGKVIGGRYCADSTNSTVDFLWTPVGAPSPTNPSVSADKVRELITKSIM